MNTSESHSLAIQKIAENLSSTGYNVTLEPPASLIPFSLGDYRPDLLATKEGDNMIIEVKSSIAKVSIEKFQKIADIVAQQKNWRFLVSTISDFNEAPNSSAFEQYTAARQQSDFRAVDRAIAADLPDLAMIKLWIILTSTLRQRAAIQGLVVETASDLRLLNSMYTLGALSLDEFERARNYMHLRNQLVHANSDGTATKNQAEEMKAFVSGIINSEIPERLGPE